jgi:maltooligosyltrehalose trehalohydrolase
MSVASVHQERVPVGATVVEQGVRFRVWAPERKSIELVLVGPAGREQRRIPLNCDEEGYFSTTVADARHGDLYFYQVDDEEKLYPDPASNFQPQGVHGPSQVFDHRRFEWTDDTWQGVRLKGQVVYELHIGTFTPEGTWEAAGKKLAHLRDLGITLIELMPVSEFPGNFGWGYDGVYWYAPEENYGNPDEMKRFINVAHRFGMGVILDVVYNHFGPSGNYTGVFSKYYQSQEHATEWGQAINFDGENSRPVREFVAGNAAYWVREFHFDGLRLDATHSMIDDSDEHIVVQLTRAARTAAGERSILVFSEDERNRCYQVLPTEQGGYGTDGIWNDDFHHSCRVAVTGNADGYYRDYAGSPQELISATRLGHLYQGQYNFRQGRYRGHASRDIPAAHFVSFLQNHDQVANAARPVRTHFLTTAGRHRAITALWLLGPQTPMFFMGQEFSASAPFHYFADHEPELAALVRTGRADFMTQFPRLTSFDTGSELADPADINTFELCKLDWSEVERNSEILSMHRDLLRLRREDPTFARQDKKAIEGAVVGPEAFILRWYDDAGEDRLLILNLGRDFDWHPVAEPLVAAPHDRRWVYQWSSEEPRYGGLGTPEFDETQWRVPGHTALVLRAARQDAL